VGWKRKRYRFAQIGERFTNKKKGLCFRIEKKGSETPKEWESILIQLEKSVHPKESREAGKEKKGRHGLRRKDGGAEPRGFKKEGEPRAGPLKARNREDQTGEKAFGRVPKNGSKENFGSISVTKKKKIG